MNKSTFSSYPASIVHLVQVLEVKFVQWTVFEMFLFSKNRRPQVNQTLKKDKQVFHLPVALDLPTV